MQQGRYRVEEVLAAGGMGAVYRAIHLNLKHACALKEMLERFADEEERKLGVEWFEREAQMLLRLSHPMIPRIFDSFAEDEQYYLVMELVDGRTLARVLEQEGKPRGLPEARVRQWAIQLCEVLAYLHERKPHPVIFRDLKPTNIMLTKDEEIRLIDFGIARAFQEGTGTQVMTLGYAPLEQIRGKAEPRSDLYALGATLHQMLTAKKPSVEEFVPVRRLRAEISLAFEAIIHKALQEDLAARWASAREMGEALRALPPLS